jgi:hypothetical protein
MAVYNLYDGLTEPEGKALNIHYSESLYRPLILSTAYWHTYLLGDI